MRAVSLFALAVFAWACAPSMHAEQVTPGLGTIDLSKPVQDLARRITAKLRKADKQSVGVVPLRERDERTPELGAIVADALEMQLARGAVDVVRRASLEKHVSPLAANQLGAIDTRVAKRLASLTGVAAIVTGTITVRPSRLVIECRLFDASTGRAIGTAQTEIDLDPDAVSQLERLFDPRRRPGVVQVR